MRSSRRLDTSSPAATASSRAACCAMIATYLRAGTMRKQARSRRRRASRMLHGCVTHMVTIVVKIAYIAWISTALMPGRLGSRAGNQSCFLAGRQMPQKRVSASASSSASSPSFAGALMTCVRTGLAAGLAPARGGLALTRLPASGLLMMRWRRVAGLCAGASVRLSCWASCVAPARRPQGVSSSPRGAPARAPCRNSEVLCLACLGARAVQRQRTASAWRPGCHAPAPRNARAPPRAAF